MSKGKRMTKEEVEHLLYQREMELEDERKIQRYIETIRYQQTERARAEGYQEAIKDILHLIQEILKR